jgi:hypothetical protein
MVPDGALVCGRMLFSAAFKDFWAEKKNTLWKNLNG